VKRNIFTALSNQRLTIFSGLEVGQADNSVMAPAFQPAIF
jgi:hypothetical protein